jgi:hypothetical protein
MNIVKNADETWILETRECGPDGVVRVRRKLRATTVVEARREARNVLTSLEREEV